MVLRNLCGLYRAEGAKSHMQRDKRRIDALVSDLLQQFLGKVQTGCRCSCRADFTGIDSLIAFLILQFHFYIRRERHFPKLIQDFQENPLVFKFDDPVAVLPYGRDSTLEQAFPENNRIANLHFPTGFA